MKSQSSDQACPARRKHSFCEHTQNHREDDTEKESDHPGEKRIRNHAENPVNAKSPRSSRRSRVRSGLVDSVKNTERPVKINQVTKNVEIPQIHHSDKMIDVPVVLQRQVPHVQAVHKNVEIHQAAVHRQNLSTPP